MISPCTKSGEPYKISGCTPKMCLAPSAVEKQDYHVARLKKPMATSLVPSQVSEHSLEMRFFSVMAQCKGLGRSVHKKRREPSAN